MSNTPQSILKIAHRGASGYESENSMRALQKAIELDCDIVECDVQITKDGVPIIRHDKLLDRTTNAQGYVWEYTWKEIEENIRLKDGQSISSLADFCKAIADSGLQLYLDLKTFGAEELILNTCLRTITEDKFQIGSFHAPSIKHIKDLNPKAQTILILEGKPFDIKEIIAYSACDILALGFDSIDQQSIDEAHQMKKSVFSWTINHPREIDRAKKMGIDGIVSDFPDRI